MTKEKYLILDEEKDRELVEELTTLLIVSESDVAILPLMVNVTADFELEGITVSGHAIKLEVEEELKEILKTEKDIEIAGCLIRENDDYSQATALGDSLEDAVYRTKYMCAQTFIELKKITSMEQLKLEKEKLENKFCENFKTFDEWDEEDRIYWGIDALNSIAECPDCGAVLKNLGEAESDEVDFVAHLFECRECFDHYAVITDQLGTVISANSISEENFKDIPKSKKKKKKKTKKSFGKNKKKKK